MENVSGVKDEAMKIALASGDQLGSRRQRQLTTSILFIIIFMAPDESALFGLVS